MTARVRSAVIIGIDAVPIDVEVDVADGLPSFSLVGLPSAAVRESRDRVLAALRNSGMAPPAARTVVNLAPADLRKDTAGFELAIAVALLQAHGAIPPEATNDTLIAGELSLDGTVKPIRGALPIAVCADREGIATLLLPDANVPEASLAREAGVGGVHDLRSLVAVLRGEPIPESDGVTARVPSNANTPTQRTLEVAPDFADVRGQTTIKRAFEVAAAGGHNVLLSGPPGAGKTMLAQRLPSILPPLERAEALEVTTIHSITSATAATHLCAERPFRAPHHSASTPAIIGGGTPIRPGEVVRAHRGVLFLDELPEFAPRTLDALRQPLEERRVTVARAQGAVTFPADVMLVAAMNPCPCGYRGVPGARCACPPGAAERYRSRVSGPLLDRIDIHATVAPLPPADLLDEAPADCERSEEIRRRVCRVREISAARSPALPTNASLRGHPLTAHCRPEPSAQPILHDAAEHFRLSARAVTRILRVARTIADLADSSSIRSAHLLEALQYRAAGPSRAGERRATSSPGLESDAPHG